MRDLRDILSAFDRVSREGGRGVLASVVGVEGSTYRRPGARLLVLPGPGDRDHEMIGLISGGCLEGDLLERALAVRADGEPRLVRYDSTSDDDIVWGLGLGCAGVVEILLECVDRDQPGPLPFLASCLRERSSGVLATALRSDRGVHLGTRWRLTPDGRFESDAAGRELATWLEPALRASVRTTRVRHAGTDILIERVQPAPRLLVCGAGPDARPLVRMAAELGWTTLVTDGRPAYARADRFPDADSVVLCEAERAAETVAVDCDTYAVIMTHHYGHDRALLRWLLPSPARYIGVLGPKQRSDDLLRDLRDAGIQLTDEERERVFAPPNSSMVRCTERSAS